MYATDLDADGDVDVLSASSSDHKIAWYENIDGKGGFGPQQVITTAATRAQSVYAIDLDGDGDLDVLSASMGDDKIAWYEQLASLAAGDANGDFHFDQRDVVQVLQTAKYLSGAPAAFEEGDWNGDGVFDQRDIVAALETDHYLLGPYAVHVVDSVHAQFG